MTAAKGTRLSQLNRLQEMAGTPQIQGTTGTPVRPLRKARSSDGERKVRYTIELDRGVHRALRQYALDRDVDASEVVRALLDLVIGDVDAEVRMKVEAQLGRGN